MTLRSCDIAHLWQAAGFAFSGYASLLSNHHSLASSRPLEFSGRGKSRLGARTNSVPPSSFAEIRSIVTHSSFFQKRNGWSVSSTKIDFRKCSMSWFKGRVGLQESCPGLSVSRALIFKSCAPDSAFSLGKSGSSSSWGYTSKGLKGDLQWWGGRWGVPWGVGARWDVFLRANGCCCMQASRTCFYAAWTPGESL